MQIVCSRYNARQVVRIVLRGRGFEGDVGFIKMESLQHSANQQIPYPNCSKNQALSVKGCVFVTSSFSFDLAALL